MAKRMKAWQCIGCGRIEGSATCLGICEDVPISVVSAADYDAARRELDELRLFLRQLAHSSPRSGEGERSFRVAQERARRLLGEQEADRLPACRRTLAILLLAAGSAAAQSPQTHQHSFHDAQQWAQVFDDPARDEWQKPHQVIGALSLKPDARVADLGAGTGYFSARLSRMLPQGKVYAVDVEPGMVKYLGERAEREGLKNLYPVKGSAQEANLPEPVTSCCWSTSTTTSTGAAATSSG